MPKANPYARAHPSPSPNHQSRTNHALPSYASFFHLSAGRAAITDTDALRATASYLESYNHYLGELIEATDNLMRHAETYCQDDNFQVMHQTWVKIKHHMSAFQNELHEDSKHLVDKSLKADYVFKQR
ncbi:MAG: hypothetical protein R2865_14830 [Deinococcales bacterium]